MIWWILVAGAFVLLYLGSKVSTGNIARVASNSGFVGRDLITAIAIAYAESGGDTNAVGDQKLAPDRGPSIGLWQINIGNKVHPEYAFIDLTDPQVNSDTAFAIYRQAGNSFRPWSTFNSGSFVAYIDRAQKEMQV